MIRRHRLLNAFEDAQRRRPADYQRNLRVYDNLWREARDLGQFSQPTLAGIGSDIDYARVVNGRPVERPTRLADVLEILRSHRPSIKAFGVSGMTIYGSVARDQARPESDVDILVEFDRLVGYFTLVELEMYLEQILQRAVHLTTPGALNDRIRERIHLEGVRAA